jgi:hypothetical protein
MKSMSNRSLLPAAIAALAGGLAAQTTGTVPAHAEITESHQSVGLPFGAPGFRTQLLVDPAAIAPSGALLTGIRFRVDRASLPLGATSVPNVTVSLSHTTQTLTGVSDSFANNVTSAPTVVFQGTVVLPGYSGGNAGAMPWDIDIQFASSFSYSASQGQLLIDIVGNNAWGAFPSYWLDAAEPGGSATAFGHAGDNATFDNLNLLVATGPDLDASRISVGNTIDFVTTLSFASPPAFFAISTTALPTPLDLAPIGAPTNELYLAPDAILPLSWTQSFIGFFATVSLSVPNDPTLLGTLLYGQSAIVEPTSNQLGLVCSSAVEVRIGDQLEPALVRQLDTNDPAAATGAIVDFAFGFGSPRFGHAVFRLEGTFF